MLSFFSPNKMRVVTHTPNILLLLNTRPRTYATASARTVRNNSNQESIRKAALQRYGLDYLNLTWPVTEKIADKVNYTEKNPCSIDQMYGDADLSFLPIFKGGYINFGYWPDTFNSRNITVEQRINASKEMYKVIGSLADILQTHNLLEVGCGLGHGTALLSELYQPKFVVGLDISPKQIARAKKQQANCNNEKLFFTVGKEKSMPFMDNSFDRLISVEAAQHFHSIHDFSSEAKRVLKPGGKLVVTSFFPTTKEGVNALNAIVPNYHIHGSQNTINDVEVELARDFNNVKLKSIGKNVWYGFSKWLDQIGYQNQWSKIWYALYEKGLIDYIICEAEVPELTSEQQITPLCR